MTLPRPLFLLSALSVAALSLTGCKDNPARPAVLQVVDGTIRPGATPDPRTIPYVDIAKAGVQVEFNRTDDADEADDASDELYDDQED